MRVWSLHPRYLDQKGLVACWRETLLAQKVLLGETKGYRSHPQLVRFRAQPDPVAAVGVYLRGIHEESVIRGYRFDATKIVREGPVGLIAVTEGQLAHELAHLRAKLEVRDPARIAALPEAPGLPDPHPLFRVVPGGVEDWEKV